VYFEDKGDLLRALAEDFIERILVAAAAWWQLPAGATKDDLRRAMQAVFDAYLPHKVIMAAVVEVASYDTGLRTLFGHLLERTIGEVAAHMPAARRRVRRAGLDRSARPRGSPGWPSAASTSSSRRR